MPMFNYTFFFFFFSKSLNYHGSSNRLSSILFQRFLDIESFQLFDGSMARVSFPSFEFLSKGKSYYVRRNSFSGKVEEDPLLFR